MRQLLGCWRSFHENPCIRCLLQVTSNSEDITPHYFAEKLLLAFEEVFPWAESCFFSSYEECIGQCYLILGLLPFGQMTDLFCLFGFFKCMLYLPDPLERLTRNYMIFFINHLIFHMYIFFYINFLFQMFFQIQ